MCAFFCITYIYFSTNTLFAHLFVVRLHLTYSIYINIINREREAAVYAAHFTVDSPKGDGLPDAPKRRERPVFGMQLRFFQYGFHK